MKKNLLSLLVLVFLAPGWVMAQTPTFKVAQDTVNFTFSASAGDPTDNITNISSANLALQWDVISTNFPVSWLTANAFGICDNSLCRYNTGDTLLWNSATESGHLFTSTYYANTSHDSLAGYSLSLNGDSSTVGCYYVSIKIKDVASGYADTITFDICLPALGVPSVPSQSSDVLIYPNPATTDLNVIFGANADVKNIAIYNIIGKIVKVYKVTGNSADLSLNDIPAGLYLVRLFNSHGELSAVRKFTKQ